jgi:hypothetical protein
MEQELRLIGSTEKKGSRPNRSNFLGWFFHVFRGKKKQLIFSKSIVVSKLKNCIK